jgi:hypothetical protein
LLCNLFKVPFRSSFSLLYAFKGLPVYSRCSFVGSHKAVSVTQDVSPIDLVIEKIEPIFLLLLGLPV